MKRTGIPENFSAFNLMRVAVNVITQIVPDLLNMIFRTICKTFDVFLLQPFQMFPFSFSIRIQPILGKLLSHLRLHVKRLYIDFHYYLVFHLDWNILWIFIHVGHGATILLLVQQQLEPSCGGTETEKKMMTYPLRRGWQ